MTYRIHSPRMTRLPSLKELSDHLHYSVHSTPTSQAISDSGKPITPPKLNVSINPNTSPFAQSPSSRLKLPPSAIKRALSTTSSSSTVRALSSLIELDPNSTPLNGDIFTNSDPFAPLPVKRTHSTQGFDLPRKPKLKSDFEDNDQASRLDDNDEKNTVNIVVQGLAAGALDVKKPGQSSMTRQDHALRHSW